MLCPVCNVDLMMSDRSGVEIDYCPKCRGVWLERGELDKIIERSIPQKTQSTHQQDFHHKYHSDHHYERKKKESWLGELFDF